MRRRKCAYCGELAGPYTVHRDAFAEGPEVPLCHACATGDEPSMADIWARIGRSDTCVNCQEEIRPGDERRGSFHSWCQQVVRDREMRSA